MEEKKSKDSRIKILIKIAILMVLYVTVAAVVSMCLDKLMRFTNSNAAITSLSSMVGCLFGTFCFYPSIIDLSEEIEKFNLKEQIRKIDMKKEGYEKDENYNRD